MKSGKKQYHHGDLYRSLINASKKILQTTGLETLSMRRLAEVSGVSRTAPYHHFRDKKALLCAIAEDGFRQQDTLLEELTGNEGTENSAERFQSFVIAYIHFAVQNPEQYDLMYGGEIWKSGSATISLNDAAKQSFKRWLSEINKLQTEGLLKQEIVTLRLAQVTWATLHGLCRLFNDGIYVNSDDIDEMGRTAVSLLLNLENSGVAPIV